MSDLFPLIRKTSAYKTVLNDKLSGNLSHAYLILTNDKDNLKEILNIFARLIFCEKEEPCGSCRACIGIKNGTCPDVLVYPADGEDIKTEDISSLIEESFLRPVEYDKKLFVLPHGESINLSAQNKLLKTLEEPPKGVHILIGAVGEYTLLPTVKSRVKKLEIPPFDGDSIFSVLKDECENTEKLKNAIACGDGTVGGAKALYGDENLSVIIDYVVDTINNMQSSKDVLDYSVKFSKINDIDGLLSVLELTFSDMLKMKEGATDSVVNKGVLQRVKDAQGYNSGAIIYIQSKILEAKKRKEANNNATMIIDWLLFSILEGKHKWQKS